MAIDAQTKILLHLDSDYTDSSQYDITGSTGGSPSISTGTKKFGDGSVDLDFATDDRIVFGDSSQYDIYGDATIDLWVYFQSAIGGPAILISRCENSSNYWYLKYDPTYGGFLSITSVISGTTKTYRSNQSLGLAVETWHHICVCKMNNAVYFFTNGTYAGASGTGGWTSAIGDVYIGVYSADGGSSFEGGMTDRYIDEVRFCTVARIADPNDKLYISSGTVADGFTAPSSAYTSYDPGGVVGYDLIHWEYDANDDLQPLEEAADIGYPDEDEVEYGVVFGYEDQYTGTLSGGGAVPTTPSIRIRNNQDDTATATISGADAGTTNTVYIFLRHGGVLELINAGSRTGNGTVGITKPEGEYIGYAVSTLDNVNSLPSDPDGFWITRDRQYLIRTAAAEAELQAITLSQYGIEVIFQNGTSAAGVDANSYVVWASMESGSEVIQLRESVTTQTEEVVFHIPRQTGFPPAKFAPGATITLLKDLRIYEIDTVEPSNGILERSSSFRVTCGNFRWAEEDTVDGNFNVATDDGLDVDTQDDDIIEARRS